MYKNIHANDDSHNRRKTPCENDADKTKTLVDKAVEGKMKELNKE